MCSADGGVMNAQRFFGGLCRYLVILFLLPGSHLRSTRHTEPIAVELAARDELENAGLVSVVEPVSFSAASDDAGRRQ